MMYLNSDHEIDHEVELGVIIGMTAKNIKKENVMDYIEGYFLGIDFTDRAMADANKKIGSPWLMAKAQDQFMAISGYVSKDQVRNPQNLDLLLYVNN